MNYYILNLSYFKFSALGLLQEIWKQLFQLCDIQLFQLCDMHFETMIFVDKYHGFKMDVT